MRNNINNGTEILLGLTTTRRSDWERKLTEIGFYGLEKIALFATAIGQEARKELYAELEKTGIKEVPHVHVRNDMEAWEFEYLKNRFKTTLFNTHVKFADLFREKTPQWSLQTYIENTTDVPTAETLEGFGGLCIDFSHWENYALLGGEHYGGLNTQLQKLASIFPIGCSHASAVKDLHEDPGIPGRMQHDSHVLEQLSNIDYLKKYVQYVPKYLSLELENSFADQRDIKAYIELDILT